MKKFLHGLRDKAEEFAAAKNPNTPFVNFPVHEASSPSYDPQSAAGLAQRTFSYFYSAQNGQFQGRVKSESTLGENDHFGYVVWPVIIMVHAIADCIPQNLPHAITCLQVYWNPGRNGYCAWKMYPGNEDIYYDDNAHAAQSLITAFEVTHDHNYLLQAQTILTELILPSAQQDGGVPWHTNNRNCRNACSTGPAAVAALRVCAIQDRPHLAAFAERALRWLIRTLRDPVDGLLWDSLVLEADGNTNINKMKWTYNVGFAIHGFTLLYERTRNPEDLRMAVSLAESALNPDFSLFDKSISNAAERMYSDSSFFLHHLVDGYLVLSKHAMTDRLRHEICRIADFGREFMLDPADGLYFRGSSPYTISEESCQKFNAKYGSNKGLEKNGQERDEQGNLCKTLIGCAAWIRILRAAEGIQTGRY